jgi:hypothetical protein
MTINWHFSHPKMWETHRTVFCVLICLTGMELLAFHHFLFIQRDVMEAGLILTHWVREGMRAKGAIS